MTGALSSRQRCQGSRLGPCFRSHQAKSASQLIGGEKGIAFSRVVKINLAPRILKQGHEHWLSGSGCSLFDAVVSLTLGST